MGGERAYRSRGYRDIHRLRGRCSKSLKGLEELSERCHSGKEHIDQEVIDDRGFIGV